MTVEERILQATILQNRARANLQEMLPDIERIANAGPAPGDALIVQSVFAVVAGNIHLNLAEAAQLEAGGDGRTP